jgi:hypothetical protein
MHATLGDRSSSFGDTGAPIDLLIDRQDGVINVCEMFAA